MELSSKYICKNIPSLALCSITPIAAAFTTRSSKISFRDWRGVKSLYVRRRRIVPHHHFELNFLKCQLIVNEAEQLQRARIGHVRAMQLNSRQFAGELRMIGCHFAVEQK